MCFDDQNTYTTKTYIRNGQQYYEKETSPRHRISWRRRTGLGGSYYPSRYYARPPRSRYMSGALKHPARHPRYGGYSGGVMPGGYSSGVVAGSYRQGVMHSGYSNGYGTGYGGYLSGARAAMPHGTAMRTYYNTTPSYGYQAHVYPPGPTTTTTTTYHVTNSQAQNHAPAPRVETRATYNQGPTREDIQMENRRVATERGAYDPRRIKPADARSDDPFWCRERNGEWHLRTYYQIENECHPGRWMMDADVGFLVFHRE